MQGQSFWRLPNTKQRKCFSSAEAPNYDLPRIEVESGSFQYEVHTEVCSSKSLDGAPSPGERMSSKTPAAHLPDFGGLICRAEVIKIGAMIVAQVAAGFAKLPEFQKLTAGMSYSQLVEFSRIRCKQRCFRTTSIFTSGAHDYARHRSRCRRVRRELTLGFLAKTLPKRNPKANALPVGSAEIALSKAGAAYRTRTCAPRITKAREAFIKSVLLQ